MEVNGYGRRGNHRRRASLRIPKDQELCQVHAQSRTCGVTAVVYQGENRNPFRPKDFL
jgi:hypothetical protein